jgi:hypothetical protein
MQHYVDFAFKQVGTSVVIVPSTTIQVNLAGTSTKALIYSDDNLTPKDNPFRVSNNGMYDFYAADGLYDIVYNIPGGATYTVEDIRLEDPTDGSDAVFGNATVEDLSVATSAALPASSTVGSKQIANSPDLAANGGSDLIGYIQGGSGSVALTAQDKFQEIVSVKDFGAVGNGINDDTAAINAADAALSSSGGGTLVFPNGEWSFTFTQPAYTNIWDFQGPEISRQQLGGSSTAVLFKNARLSYHDGPHATSQLQSTHYRTIAKGSGVNGAQYADYVLGLTVEKENWSNSALAEAGEIDGLTIFLRNGGPNSGGDPSISGGAAILANVGQINESGATQIMEAVSQVFDRATPSTLLREINVQVGMCNTRDSDYYGIILGSNVGSQDAAIRIASTTAAPWNRFIEGRKDSVDRYVVGDTGITRWRTATGNIDMTLTQDATTGNVLFTNTSGTGIFQIPQALTNVQTDTTYTLQASDRNKTVVMVNVGAITVTLPNGLGVGFTCKILQRDSGQVTVSAAGAIAVRNVDSHTKTKGQYAIIEVVVLATSGDDSVWYLTGQTAA